MRLFSLHDRLRCVSWQWMLEHPRRLASSLNKMILVTLGRYSKGWSIVALVLARRIYSLTRKSGFFFASQYLKACQVQLMQYMAGTPCLGKTQSLSSTWCTNTGCGLPRIIPASHRKVLRKRDANALIYARVYLTIFSLHRLYRHKRRHPDLKSITGYFRAIGGYDKSFFRSLRHALRISLPEFLYSCFPACAREVELGFDWRPSWSSSPIEGPAKLNNMTSLGVTAALYLRELTEWRGRKLRPGEENIAPNTFYNLGCALFPKRFHQIGTSLELLDFDLFERFCHICSPSERVDISKFKCDNLGRLGRKFEGGGKVRVFSILDTMRQSCLRPIHDWAMSVLRMIPQDGTYHQLVPLKRLFRVVDYKGPMFCYDLKSATDRFPAALQRDVLTWAFGPDFSDAWLRVVSKRPFDVPWRKRTVSMFHTGVMFWTGQPLGAYSSWPIFTLTHHLIVQYCAGAPSSGKWFDRYALLGDDIVIADKGVADRYLELMKKIGVEISLHKSLISESCVAEFAKRFMIGKTDLSPISFTVVMTIIPTFVGSLVSRVLEFRSVRKSEPFRWLGAGYKVTGQSLCPKSTGKRWLRFNLILTSPKGPFPLPPLWWHSLYAPRPVTEQDVAVVRAELLDRTSITFDPTCRPYEQYFGEDVLEPIIYGRWLKTYYRLMTPFLLQVMESNDLTPWYTRPHMSSRPDRPKRIVLVRHGMMFRCWERVLRVSHKPTLLRLES